MLRVGADMQTVHISEIGFVPGHPSFYSPVLLDKADITLLMASLQKKDRGYQELVGEFIKGHHNEEVRMIPCSFTTHPLSPHILVI